MRKQLDAPSTEWSFCNVHHGYRAGTASRFWFGDSLESQELTAVTRVGTGIIHVLKRRSIWTHYHENNGHHSLTRTDFGSLNIIAKSIEILLLRLAASRAKNLSKKIELPFADPADYGDTFIEGAVTGAQWLHRFSGKFQDSSILTHEGMSDWIADRKTNVDSLPYFKERMAEHADMKVHVDGLSLFRKLSDKFGDNYVHQAVGAVMSPPLLQITYDSSDLENYFAQSMHQPDHRLRALAEADNVPSCFPQPHQDNPLMINRSNEFWDFAKTIIPIISDKGQALKRMRTQILYGIPFVGSDEKLVQGLKEELYLTGCAFFGDSMKHLLKVIEDPQMRALFVRNVRRLKEARAAGHSWTGAKLVDMLFTTNSPIEVFDYARAEGGVSVQVRPDLDTKEVQNLLFKDFCDILSELVFAGESMEALLPCYVGFASDCDSCSAKEMLQSFRVRARCFLWCRKTGLFYRFDENGLANDGVSGL